MTTMTDTAAEAAIGAAARELHLPTVRAEATRLAEIAQRNRQSYLAFLAEVLSSEVDDRAERRRERRIHEAKFPRMKRLADFDLSAAPTVNPATIATLAGGAYLDAGNPVVLLGDSGTGKSYLLIGLGIAAASRAGASATSPAPSWSMSWWRRRTTGGSAASSPATDGSTFSVLTSSAMCSSTPGAPSCCSRS